MRVGYLGPLGTYSHEVASSYFSTKSIELVAYDTIEEVVGAAEQKQVTVAVVPIDNSLEGPVLVTLDQISRISSNLIKNGVHQSTLHIIGEHYHVVEHCLIANKDTVLANVTTVYSHSQALGQCRTWLSTHLPQASISAVSSTAKAVQIASTNSNFAAVASSLAAKEYGMEIITKSIQDSKFNQTRFVFITSMSIEDYSTFTHLFSSVKSSSKRTSVYIETAENSQELINFLKNVSPQNVISIHSRPIKGTAWKRSYFIDVEGDLGDLSGNMCKIGNYPLRVDQQLTDT